MNPACYILLIFLPVFFCSCNSPEKNRAYSDSVHGVAVTDSPVTKKDPVNPHYIETENTDPYNNNGYALMETETIGELKFGQSEKKVISILGEPDEKAKINFWDGDAAYHQTWTYKTADVELDFAGDDSLELTVNSIRMNENCTFKTSGNIGIGMSYAEVKEAYKNEITEPQKGVTFIVAGSIYGGVIFTFQDEKLISAFIGSSAE